MLPGTAGYGRTLTVFSQPVEHHPAEKFLQSLVHVCGIVRNGIFFSANLAPQYHFASGPHRIKRSPAAAAGHGGPRLTRVGRKKIAVHRNIPRMLRMVRLRVLRSGRQSPPATIPYYRISVDFASRAACKANAISTGPATIPTGPKAIMPQSTVTRTTTKGAWMPPCKK